MESVLGATPHEFKSRILRQLSSQNAGRPHIGPSAFCFTVSVSVSLLGPARIRRRPHLRTWERPAAIERITAEPDKMGGVACITACVMC